MKSTSILPGIAVALLLFLLGCAGQVNRLPEPRTVAESNVDNGRRLIASYGCGSCHSIPGIPKANAVVGPSLDHFYERSYIAGRLPNTWENLVQWIQNPQEIKPGTAMPNMGVTPADALDIAAYLYHQPTLVDLLSR